MFYKRSVGEPAEGSLTPNYSSVADSVCRQPTEKN